MQYPGHSVKVGETDGAIVMAVKQQLNTMLAIGNDPELRLDATDPTFGPKTKKVVKLFQARNVDSEGRPLKQDGEIGSITWEALFGKATVPASLRPASAYLAAVLQTAAGEEARHVREVPANSNRGPRVELYQRRAGVDPGNAWCCAFVYWCFDETAKGQGLRNPMVKTGGCLDHWNRAVAAGARRVLKANAVQDPSLVQPGMIFVIDHGGGLGHTGLVEETAGGLLTTIEGNTDASKTREGGGVYRLTRKISEINKGYIDYAPV